MLVRTYWATARSDVTLSDPARMEIETYRIALFVLPLRQAFGATSFRGYSGFSPLWGYGVVEWDNASEDLPEYVSSIRPRGDVVAGAADVFWRRS